MNNNIFLKYKYEYLRNNSDKIYKFIKQNFHSDSPQLHRNLQRPREKFGYGNICKTLYSKSRFLPFTNFEKVI